MRANIPYLTGCRTRQRAIIQRVGNDLFNIMHIIGRKDEKSNHINKMKNNMIAYGMHIIHGSMTGDRIPARLPILENHLSLVKSISYAGVYRAIKLIINPMKLSRPQPGDTRKKSSRKDGYMKTAGSVIFEAAAVQVRGDEGAMRILRAAYAATTNLCEGLQRRLTEIRNDTDLVYEAKQRKITEAREMVLAQLEGIEDLSTAQARMESELYGLKQPEQTDIQALTSYLKGREIREALADQDNLVIVHLLRKEASEGKSTYLQAIMGDPRGENLGISSDLIESILQERARQTQPDLYEQLQRVQAVNSSIQGLRGLARNIIQAESSM